MTQFTFSADQFKKMDDPINSSNKHVRYVCYANASTIPQGIEDWMETNPREQKMTTNVAKAISGSLQDNSNFHELNRGILLSAHDVDYDNKDKIVAITLLDPARHGNIDGGHTLRAIINAQKSGTIISDRYVFMEIFTGLDSPVELAAARNTSVQVYLKSIEELKDSFDIIKESFSQLPFANRIAYIAVYDLHPVAGMMIRSKLINKVGCVVSYGIQDSRITHPNSESTVLQAGGVGAPHALARSAFAPAKAARPAAC